MTTRQPFCPDRGANQVVTVGASAPINVRRDANQVRVVNTGANKGYFRCYSTEEAADKASLATCTAADVPVAAGMSTTVTKSQLHDKLSTFSATGTTFEICTGEGF